MDKEKSRPKFKKTRPWYFNENESETDSINQVKPSLTELNRIQPDSTGLNPVNTGLKNQVKLGLTRLNPVLNDHINPVKPGLTGFKNLHGNPKKVLEFLAVSILDFQQLITKQLSLSKIAESTNLSRDSVKSAIKYLIKNEIIERVDYFAGIHGWAQYSIAKHVYISVQNMIQTGLNPVMQIGSNNNSSNKITTIGDGWDEIDISPLEHRGFQKNQLLQLRGKNTPDIVQQSINHFAFALENNTKAKAYSEPLSVFMAVLKRGEGWVEPNYISPQERAMRQQLEAKRAEQGRLAKLEEELINIELEAWKSKLSKSEIDEIRVRKGKLIPESVALHLHFKETLWPDIKAKI